MARQEGWNAKLDAVGSSKCPLWAVAGSRWSDLRLWALVYWFYYGALGRLSQGCSNYIFLFCKLSIFFVENICFDKKIDVWQRRQKAPSVGLARKNHRYFYRYLKKTSYF